MLHPLLIVIIQCRIADNKHQFRIQYYFTDGASIRHNHNNNEFKNIVIFS